MHTLTPLHRYLRVLIFVLAALVVGCANTEQKTLRSYIEQGHPFEVRWKHADPWPIDSKDDLIDNLQIDTGAKIVREMRNVVVIQSRPLDDVTIAKFKKDLLDSGLFELVEHPSLVPVDVGFTELSISCNKVTFELRSYDLESTDPPELIQDKIDVVSKVTAAIKELSSAESF